MPELKYKVKNTKDYSLQESLQRLMTQAFTVGVDDNKNEITLFHVDEIPFEKKNLANVVLQPYFEDDLSKCSAIESDPVEDAELAEVVEDKIEELSEELSKDEDEEE